MQILLPLFAYICSYQIHWIVWFLSKLLPLTMDCIAKIQIIRDSLFILPHYCLFNKLGTSLIYIPYFIKEWRFIIKNSIYANIYTPFNLKCLVVSIFWHIFASEIENMGRWDPTERKILREYDRRIVNHTATDNR